MQTLSLDKSHLTLLYCKHGGNPPAQTTFKPLLDFTKLLTRIYDNIDLQVDWDEPFLSHFKNTFVHAAEKTESVLVMESGLCSHVKHWIPLAPSCLICKML